MFVQPKQLMRPINICKNVEGRFFCSSYVGTCEIIKDSIVLLSEKYPELKTRSTWVLCNPVDSSLWIATKGEGIQILKNNKVKRLTTKDGLSSNYIKHLALANNEIWVSTNNGISRIFLKNKSGNKYKIQKISTENGLISNDINQIAIVENKIYAATDKGLTVFNSADINTELPKRNGVLIKSIKINEKDTSILPLYTLPHNNSTITISFGYLSFTNAGKMNYMYRILGLSKEWEYTKSTEIRLTTLPPGAYTLEIFALFNDGDHNRFPAQVTFVIFPPYWEEWWFILLIITFVLSVLIGGTIYRIRQINRRNSLKQQLFEYQRKALSSQMNPHFIFNSLNSIQLYILKNDIRTSNRYLTKFSSLMRSILVNSNEPSNTLENEINTLQTYIELEALRFANKFNFLITVDNLLAVTEVRIPTLLIQPYVENAIWHGLMNKPESGMLTISIHSMENNCIRCIITDDGIGRKKSAEINERKRATHKSLGAKITENRLELLNTLYKKNLQITIIDLEDENQQPAGTKVELIIPIVK